MIVVVVVFESKCAGDIGKCAGLVVIAKYLSEEGEGEMSRSAIKAYSLFSNPNPNPTP